jgi:hypothetical protein
MNKINFIEKEGSHLLRFQTEGGKSCTIELDSSGLSHEHIDTIKTWAEEQGVFEKAQGKPSEAAGVVLEKTRLRDFRTSEF